MRYTYHCDACDITWPPFKNEYGKCPSCLGATKYQQGTPLGDTEAAVLAAEHAERRAKHAAFEQYYEELCLTELGADIEAWEVWAAN